MRVLVVGLLLFAVGCSTGSNCTDISDLEESNGTYKLNNKVYSGCVIKFGTNNSIFKGVINKGKLDGKFKVLKDGKLFQKGTYKEGELFGTLLMYDSVTGNLFMKENYNSKGQLHGEVITFYESGAVSKREMYSKNKKEGYEVNYYESGNVIDSIPFKNDKMNGVVKGYFENGIFKNLMSFQDGYGQGLSITFLDSEHRKFMFGSMHNGKSIGVWNYKLKEDSCFIRVYSSNSNGEFIDNPCNCIELEKKIDKILIPSDLID